MNSRGETSGEIALTDRRRLVRVLETAAYGSFGLFFFLVLTTPSWRYGPFSWLPLIKFDMLAGGPVKLGILNLLPLVVAICWLGKRELTRRWSLAEQKQFQWGNRHTTLPLLGLTLLGSISLTMAPARLQFIQLGGLALAWLVYLFMLNERPKLQPVLAAIVVVQGVVAIAQFLNQGDLGLDWLGELPLNPIFEGVSVIVARDKPWLRAYGLTAHPNLLGAILSALLLLLLPVVIRAQSWRGILWSAAYLVGLLGLVLSFSRAAGLAFGAGLLTWLLLRDWHPKTKTVLPRISNLQPLLAKYLKFILPLLLLIGLLWVYSDLFLSRLTNLDAPSEAQSLNQRLEDAQMALHLIAENPLTGVGLGSYTDVAQMAFPQAARVHNVLLLVTAELGIFGLILLLWLFLAPFLIRPVRAAAIAPWILMLIIGLFDTTLWLTSNWQTAVLFGLLAANLWTNQAPPTPEPS
jgi:hypothetical protein